MSQPSECLNNWRRALDDTWLSLPAVDFTQTFPIFATQTACKQTVQQQVYRGRKTYAWNNLVVRDTALFGHHNSYLQACSKSSSMTTLPFPPFLSFS